MLGQEKLRKQTREHNEAIVRVEKVAGERAAQQVRQVEKDYREKEIYLQERLEMQLKQLQEDHMRQLESV